MGLQQALAVEDVMYAAIDAGEMGEGNFFKAIRVWNEAPVVFIKNDDIVPLSVNVTGIEWMPECAVGHMCDALGLASEVIDKADSGALLDEQLEFIADKVTDTMAGYTAMVPILRQAVACNDTAGMLSTIAVNREVNIVAAKRKATEMIVNGLKEHGKADQLGGVLQ